MAEQTASANTYAKLFPEQLANPCSPDAPESNNGPIAYLHALYQKAQALENASDATTRVTLTKRRPDIGKLLLDPNALEQPVSALTLAISALTHHAQECAGTKAYLPEVLASAGLHACLPFNYAHEQAKTVLSYKKVPYFELLQQAQYSYPSFCYEGLRSDELRQVMRNASGFSPALQTLLLDQKPLRGKGDDWRKWYGMADIDAKKAIASLLDVETFGRRTGLSFEQILELLAVAGIDDDATASYSLVRSSTAYRPTGESKLKDFHYGAAYINAHQETPLTIKDALAGEGIKPQFDSLHFGKLARMYQMIHLQRALALPFNEVDLLLMSILRAEGQSSNWNLTPSTLRAFGVFRYLNEAYGTSAEQFAALVCEVNPYAVGEQVPMLDRILDGPGAGQGAPLNPLVLDDRAFDPADGNDGQFKVVPALAKALGVDEQATLVYLEQVKQAQKLEKLTLSLSLLSALYRLSRLHRLFQRSAREASALVELLATTGTNVMAQLAGTPVISDTQGSDVLDTLVAMSNLDQWLRQQQILPSVLLEALAPVPTTEEAQNSSLPVTFQHNRELIEHALDPEATESQQQEGATQLLMIIVEQQRTMLGVSRQHVPPLLGWSSQGVEQVLAWETQELQEPGLGSTEPVDMDLHGANALYFRELFLHLPALVAMRLTEQQQFEEAEDWYLRYLFNPYRTKADEQGRPAPWCTRPLAQVGTLSSTLRKGVDPINRVFTLSRHYQQAIYLSLLENWLLQGDHFYRQLTLSSLNQAWLCYQQAQQLLGPLPRGSDASRWTAVTLASVKQSKFRRPLNSRVLDLHQTLQSRLYNLRHGLTLDGKLLPALDWSSESLDAFDTGRGGVSNVPIPYRSGQVDIPHYRFRQLLPLAKAAAQQLSDFGRHYMSLMEEEFNTSLAVQLKAQDIKMADFAIRLQKEAISSVQAKKKVLLLSRDKSLAQKEYLSDLIDVGRSPEEEAATAFTWIANVQRVGSIAFEIVGGVTATTVPTIYGFSFGGNKPDAIAKAAAADCKTFATISDMIAKELETQAAYNRRAAGWVFDKSQVEWDLQILDQQIKETNIELNAATIALSQVEQERVNLKEAYVSMTTGFTIIPIYNWLVARQEQIYGAAYDAVRSLCMGVEAAWRYEIGDYRRDSFIDTTAWRDNYKGMLVGESLLVNLQQMENEYLARNERRLTIKKSFSLKKQMDSSPTKAEEKWAKVFKKDEKRTQPLTHAFAFTAQDFDKSYPGQYLRQLKYVSVTFVLKADKPVEELCALLKQTGSTTLLEPNTDAAFSFYPESKDDTKAEAARENPRLVLRNPRENQQIALSSTVAEDGLGYDAGTWVYELMFHDGRYLPFEGTGAISQWTLELLGDEGLLKDPSVIEDIRFNMVYTAKAGDEAFIKAISDARKTPATASKS